jgi:hypothetical protein
MTFKNYSRVKLLTDSHLSEGVGKGAIGYVIEVYPGDEYEVEFSDKDGITIALLSVKADEIMLCEKDEGH